MERNSSGGALLPADVCRAGRCWVGVWALAFIGFYFSFLGFAAVPLLAVVRGLFIL